MPKRPLALVTALLIAVTASVALADVPASLSYQGVLTDGNGVVVPDGSYELLFQIFDTAQAGAGGVFFGQQLDVEVTDGLYNVILSTWEQNTLGKDLKLAFEDTSFPRYMQVKIVDGPGTALDGVVLLPRQQIASVPFALVSARSETADALAGQGNRVVLFTTSSNFTNDRFGSGNWFTFRNTTGSGDMELSVTTTSGCVIEVSAGGSIGDSSGPHEPAMTILENGVPAGVPITLVSAADSGSTNDRSSGSLEYVNLIPMPNTTFTYKLAARSATDAVDQGASVDGVSVGAYLKVVMECGG